MSGYESTSPSPRNKRNKSPKSKRKSTSPKRANSESEARKATEPNTLVVLSQVGQIEPAVQPQQPKEPSQSPWKERKDDLGKGMEATLPDDRSESALESQAKSLMSTQGAEEHHDVVEQSANSAQLETTMAAGEAKNPGQSDNQASQDYDHATLASQAESPCSMVSFNQPPTPVVPEAFFTEDGITSLQGEAECHGESSAQENVVSRTVNVSRSCSTTDPSQTVHNDFDGGDEDGPCDDVFGCFSPDTTSPAQTPGSTDEMVEENDKQIASEFPALAEISKSASNVDDIFPFDDILAGSDIEPDDSAREKKLTKPETAPGRKDKRRKKDRRQKPKQNEGGPSRGPHQPKIGKTEKSQNEEFECRDETTGGGSEQIKPLETTRPVEDDRLEGSCLPFFNGDVDDTSDPDDPPLPADFFDETPACAATKHHPEAKSPAKKDETEADSNNKRQDRAFTPKPPSPARQLETDAGSAVKREVRTLTQPPEEARPETAPEDEDDSVFSKTEPEPDVKTAQSPSEASPVAYERPTAGVDTPPAVTESPATPSSSFPTLQTCQQILAQPPVPAPAETDYIRKASQLEEMGYTNREEVLTLLKFHKGDIGRVLDSLGRIRLLEPSPSESSDPAPSTADDMVMRESRQAYSTLLDLGFFDDGNLMNICVQMNGNLDAIIDYLSIPRC